MDQKQKQELKASKRADKLLAEQQQVEREKQDYQQRITANIALKKQFTQDLTAIAQESGILALAEEAADTRGGRLVQEVSYFVDYGTAACCVPANVVDTRSGKLRAGYLALRITWEENGQMNEVEIQLAPNGQITFHNSLLPVFAFIWRRNPQILQTMLGSALEHPRTATSPAGADV